MAKQFGEMKTTDNFKQVIEKGLRLRAFTNNQLAEALKKPNKSIEGCCNYILKTVKATNANGFTDDEVFNMAMHYFYEDNIKAEPFKGSYDVFVNEAVLPKGEELEKLRDEARERVIKQEMDKMRKKPEKKPVTKKEVEKKQNGDPQKSLF